MGFLVFLAACMDSFAHNRSCSGSVRMSSGSSKYLRTRTLPFFVIYEKGDIPVCSYFFRLPSSTEKYRLFPIIMANCIEPWKIPTPPKKRPIRTGPMGSRSSKTYSVYSALADNGFNSHWAVQRSQSFALTAHRPRIYHNLLLERVYFPCRLSYSSV